MNNNLTELVVVLDKSGSMSSVQTDAIGGFNSFLKSQQEAKGEANMTVVLFDTEVSFYASNAPVKTVKPLDDKAYVPSGMTALYDAVCMAVDEVGKRLAKMEEKDRPGKVIFAILTDGEENSSKEFDRKKTFDRIATQRDIYKWEFLFLAAGADAFKAGQNIGMTSTKMAMFVNNSKGVGSVYDTLCNYSTAYRGMEQENLTAFSSSVDLQSEVDAMVANKASTIDVTKLSNKKTKTVTN